MGAGRYVLLLLALGFGGGLLYVQLREDDGLRSRVPDFRGSLSQPSQPPPTSPPPPPPPPQSTRIPDAQILVASSLASSETPFGNFTAARFPGRSVPFYVYDSPVTRKFEKCKVQNPYHGTELEFLRLVEEHPWRVVDPEDAVLFVVPFLLGTIVRKGCPDFEGREGADELAHFIESSPYFQRHKGADHLLVATDWRARRTGAQAEWRRFWKVAKNFIVAHVGSLKDRPWRCTVVTPHVIPLEDANATTREAIETPTATEFLDNRPYNFFFQGQTGTYAGYETRRTAAKHLKGVLEPSLFVSAGQHNYRALPRCKNEGHVDEFLSMVEAGNMTMPANPDDVPRMDPCTSRNRETFHLRLKHSKLNLMFSGTNPGSSRLYESINRAVATLVLDDELRHFFTPFECSVDWENLVFWGSEKEFVKNPEEYLTKYVNALTTEDYDRVLRTMERHKADLDWYHAESRVATNILFPAARKCLPHVSVPCKFEDRSEEMERKSWGRSW